MNNYKSIILNKLIDKYERSLLYKGVNKVDVRILFKFTKEALPDYYNEYNYEFKQEINDECMNLENKDLIRIVWKPFEKGNIIEKVILNDKNLDGIYVEVNREEKQSFEDKAINILRAYANRDGWFGAFASEMLERLNDKKSVKKYLEIEDTKLIENILKAIDNMLKQQYEVPKRVFSIRIFNDSKIFESLESKALKIAKDYAGFDEEEDILSEFNIVSNPGFVFLKGSCTFTCGNQSIDLSKLNGEIGLSTELINSFTVEKLEVKRIITIENLTTFHSYQPEEELVIYLGGYHNAIRRALLKKVHSFSTSMEFYHWGDIDLGGFRIFNHLTQKTGIPFIPYKMDVETLRKYENYTKRIENKAYIDNLEKLAANKDYLVFRDVLAFMLEHEVKLEQEAIDLK